MIMNVIGGGNCVCVRVVRGGGSVVAASGWWSLSMEKGAFEGGEQAIFGLGDGIRDNKQENGLRAI